MIVILRAFILAQIYLKGILHKIYDQFKPFFSKEQNVGHPSGHFL